jgi:hypothetical protein
LATILLVSCVNGYAAQSTPVKDSFGIGAQFATINRHDFAVVANYINPYFEVGAGGNFEHVDFGSKKISVYEVLGFAGLKNDIEQNVYLDYGIMGSDVLYPHEKGPTQKSLGAYVGVGYLATKHLVLTAKIFPYNTEEDVYNTKFQTSFEDGAIGISYQF